MQDVVSFDLSALLNVGVAVLGGLAVGIEREWSGKARGPRARFAGVRTFTLLGLVAGLSGWLWTSGLTGLSIVLLAGVAALVVMAYQAASRTDVEGTTEVAAFVILAAGVLAGAGYPQVGSAITALTVFLLVEKKQLHRIVSKLDQTEVRAAARFAVMAAVILPILPPGPYGPLGGVRPRLLWALVLFFSGLSFVGYLARRSGLGSHGYALAGALGGIYSSTTVTLTFARLSRQQPSSGRSLAAGALGANVVLLPRVLIACAVLAPALAKALWPAFVAPAIVGIGLALYGLRDSGRPGSAERKQNPLQVGAALQMAALFQVVLWVSAIAKQKFGAAGLYGTAAVLGLVDMDALTISMAQQTAAGTAASLAAHAILIGILANTAVKLGITLVIGRGLYRTLTALGLVLMGVGLGAGLRFVL
jgi:uncharacterized membrane protein (DUF4010 family)